MKPLIIKVKGNDTVGFCVRPTQTPTYNDTIMHSQVYVDVSQLSIQVINSCNTSFLIPAQEVFRQNDADGSTFNGSIKETLIPAMQTVNIPIYYNGAFKTAYTNFATYQFALTGINGIFTVIVVAQLPNQIGTISDITFDDPNRYSRTFTATDFNTHFTDPDNNDTIATVAFFGNVSTLWYNGNPYIADTEIPLSEINAGNVFHRAPDVNQLVTTVINYRIKDSNGNIIT